MGLIQAPDPPHADGEKSSKLKCPEEDSNLQGMLIPPRPQRGASANSATRALGLNIYAVSVLTPGVSKG